MSTRITMKERILQAVRDLPADATTDDAIETIVFIAKVEEGLAQLDEGQAVSHEDVKRRFRA
jgi:predicted transcriptional regulator